MLRFHHWTQTMINLRLVVQIDIIIYKMGHLFDFMMKISHNWVPEMIST